MRRFFDRFRCHEDELLLSSRMHSFGGWAKEFKVNPCWIKDGRISSEDYHSWLRVSQLQGREVCILGADKSICRVCIEAWNAGFKPVLVLLQDLVAEDVKADLLLAASRLQRCRYRSGLLHTALEVLVVDSHQVTVKLDVDGQAMDVNVAAPHFCYPFQGPAILLGSILRQDMLEDVHEKSLEAHQGRIGEESAAVLDPSFWEERRDPDCLPLAIMTYQNFLPACALSVFQTMAMVAVHKAHDKAYSVVWRVLVGTIYRLPCGHGVGILFAACLLEIPRGRCPFSFSMMWLFEVPVTVLMFFKVDGYLIVSDFVLGAAGLLVTALFLLAYAKHVVRIKMTRWAVLWYAVSFVGLAGGWGTSVPILLIYQLLQARNGFFASIYLAVAFAGMEAAFVKFLSTSYVNLVARKRPHDPTCIPGDQKQTVSVTIHCINLFTETARLATLMSGAIAAADVSFLRYVIIFSISSVAVNTAVRTATVCRFTIRIPVIGKFLCPTSFWAAHNNSRFTMGWGRFFCIFGVMLGRGLVHGQWETSMNPKPGVHSTWCWSGTVLITVCLAFLSEVLEDVLVFYLTRSGYPFPNTRTYEEIMWKRLRDPATAARQHVCHYAIPQLVDPPILVLEEEEEAKLNRIGPPPSLTNQRLLDFQTACLITCSSGVLLMIDLSVGIGSGNIVGYCRPLDIKRDSFRLILRNAVLWDMECKF